MNASAGPHFERCVYIGVPAARLWQAIVDPELARHYYLTPLKQLDLQPGGRIAYGPPGEDLIVGEVVDLEPLVRLTHTFRFTFRPDVKPSRVVFNVEDLGPELSCLWLVHDDFGDDLDTYEDVRIGWDRILSNLKTLLETGKPLKWPEQ